MVDRKMGDRKIRGLTGFGPIFLSLIFLSTVLARLPGKRRAGHRLGKDTGTSLRIEVEVIRRTRRLSTGK